MSRDGLFWWVVLVTTISLGAGLELRGQVLQPGNHIVSENANRVKQVLESHDEIVQDKTEAKVKRDMMIDRARERDDVKQFLHLQAREEARKTHRADTVHRRKSLFLRGLQAKYEAMERKEDEARLGSALGGRKEEQQKQLEYDQQLKAIQLGEIRAKRKMREDMEQRLDAMNKREEDAEAEDQRMVDKEQASEERQKMGWSKEEQQKKDELARAAIQQKKEEQREAENDEKKMAQKQQTAQANKEKEETDKAKDEAKARAEREKIQKQQAKRLAEIQKQTTCERGPVSRNSAGTYAFDSEKWKLPNSNNFFVSFEVKADKEARVCLADTKRSMSANTVAYEVVLGAKVSISRQVAGQPAKSGAGALSKGAFSPMWIRKRKDGSISVGTGPKVGKNQLVSWKDPKPMRSQFFDFAASKAQFRNICWGPLNE